MYFPKAVDSDHAIEKEPGDNDAMPVYGEKYATKPTIDFDAIFIPDESDRVSAIVSQLLYCNVKNICLLGTNLWHSNKLIEKSGKNLGKAIIPDGFFAESRQANVQQFVRAYKDAYMEPPGFLEAVTYDSAMMVFDVVKHGAMSYKEFRDALKNTKGFKGITGTTSFDATGDAVKSVYLLQADGSGFKELSR